MSSTSHYSLLVVDDEPDLRTLYELTLLREGYSVETASCVKEAWQQLQHRAYSAVITDMRLPDGNGMELLRRLDETGRNEKTIIITAYGSPENAVQALKAGAYDYLTKPVDLKQFRSVVASALGRAPERPVAAGTAALPQSHNRRRLQDTGGSALQRMVGQSPAMQQVRRMVDKVARSMAPVLIQGESGTGKELVARAIHQVSSRAGRPFIAVNCGAIPEQLLEAEFFGYRKGAFTGANEDREGFFQAAHGGSLFLDEIGDLPLSMQSKLLRSIQERAVRAVGAINEVPVDVRILSATHKRLDTEVEAGRFRQDLYYRLNVIEIPVPALRERLSDLPDLCERTLERIARESGAEATPRLTPAALARLGRLPFPGNVRELENLLHRAVALSGGDEIDVDDLGLPDEPLQRTLPATPDHADTGPLAVGVAPLPARLPTDLAAYLDEVERGILVRALEEQRYNRTAAGARLGLTLRQIRYRIARLAIQAPGDGPAPDDAEAAPDPLPRTAT